MKRVLFTCLGNIYRNPMAEFIMRNLVKEAGVEERVLCASVTTSGEETIRDIGNPMYPTAKAGLRRCGISCGEKRAVLLKRADYMNYDYLICMEERDLRDAERILHKDPEGKLRLLLLFVEKAEEKAEIAGPWYTSDFVTYADQITAGCEDLLRTPGEASVRPIAEGNTACQNK